MNRREHLLRSSAALSRWPWHHEHLIVDWSSREPLRREELPADPRLRLLRVEGEARWNLCRAYNFALARARGPWLLKLDADCWPTEAFALDRLLDDDAPDPAAWALGRGAEGRKGQFLIHQDLFASVGGFNEYLVGYGFDDKDLRARLEAHTGRSPAAIPADWLAVINHSDAERAEAGREEGSRALGESLGLARMRATRLANRLLVAYHPWSTHAAASSYALQPDGSWLVLPATVPTPSATIAAEIDHARRMVFWSTFLAIPEVFLETLPFQLFPPARQGHWPVRWWHRLYWFTGRRLLQLPVILVAWGGMAVRAGRRIARRR